MDCRIQPEAGRGRRLRPSLCLTFFKRLLPQPATGDTLGIMRIRAFGFSTMLLTGLVGLWAEPVLKRDLRRESRFGSQAGLGL